MSESSRLRALHDYHILDTPPEQAFDELVRTAASFLNVPIALMSLLDESRQWFKARHGIAQTHTPRDIAFCQEVIASGQLLIVPDARGRALCTQPTGHGRTSCACLCRRAAAHLRGRDPGHVVRDRHALPAPV